MKRLFLIIISLFTIITIQSQDIFDKLIKLLTDCKQAKEVIIEDSKNIKESFTSLDSLRNYYLFDSIFITKKDTIK